MYKGSTQLSLFLAASVSSTALASDDVFELSLEEIADVKITSVSKRVESAFEASAAVYTISQEDIVNSGALYVPEILRTVPGLQVSRIDSSRWAISARGFARDFASRMLVLIDGRTIYNPLVSGVAWDKHNIPLSDVERIEVIRGPGATVWGANAVNGVINVITKTARESQGVKFSTGVGDQEKYFAEGVYGARVGADSFLKLYAKSYERNNETKLDKSHSTGDWGMDRAGFRFETALDEDSELTLIGDIYKGSREEDFDALPALTPTLITEANTDVERQGGHFTAKYKNHLSNRSVIDLQFYYDNNQFEALPALLDFKIDTFDVDFQHSWSLPNNELVWGLGYRLVSDDITSSNFIRYDSQDLEQNNQTFSAFVQDRIELLDDKLYLTLGSKFEHNDFTGFEWQPSARVSYLPNNKNTLWASFSKAARVPTRNEQTVDQIIGAIPPFGFTALFTTKDYESEDLYAYEIGYRSKPAKNISLDFAGFYNNYKNLRSFELASNPGTYPDVIGALQIDNQAKADNYGFEVAAKWNVNKNWQLDASYSLIKIDMDLESGSTDFVQKDDEGKTPRNMFNLHSHLKLGEQFDMDNYLYYVDNIATPGVKNYIKFDTRIGWKPTENIRLDLIGENLFDEEHQEFDGGTYNKPSEISRSVYGKLTLNF